MSRRTGPDLGDVYMTFFLPTGDAGRVKIGTDVHLKLDAAPLVGKRGAKTLEDPPARYWATRASLPWT